MGVEMKWPHRPLVAQILLAGDQPAAFLQKAMDPPAPEAVAAATRNLQVRVMMS
jgi:hypothetical protein